MKILLVSSEVAPFAKTGGLADVAGALPIALARLGHDVRVAMPAYSTINYHGEQPVLALPHVNVMLGWKSYIANVSEARLPESTVPVYFISNPSFFNRSALYQERGQDYPDNAHRFAFFCKAVIWMIKGLGWIPDVIHCNDWQTGPLPTMLKTDAYMRGDEQLRGIRTMFTIHNLAYQGLFSADTAADLGFGDEVFHPGAMEFYGSLNFLKGGLVFSDMLTTVSPTYAREIQTPEFGCGLEGVLRQRTRHLFGILNGIDYQQWNPKTDTNLPAHYSAENTQNKAACKVALQAELGLEENAQIPLLVMISRLDPQKGLDILLPLVQDLMKRKLQLAILGTGLLEYHQALEAAAAKFKSRMAVQLKFDNGLAHRMEAGADIFLMPSRYEPCGLNQLYSLRYGTLPVVRKTGGLADSVEQTAADGSSGTGFVFEEYTGEALLAAIDRAIRLYENQSAWQQIQQRAMTRDFSWNQSAARYSELYDQLVG